MAEKVAFSVGDIIVFSRKAMLESGFSEEQIENIFGYLPEGTEAITVTISGIARKGEVK